MVPPTVHSTHAGEMELCSCANAIAISCLLQAESQTKSCLERIEKAEKKSSALKGEELVCVLRGSPKCHHLAP